DVATAAETASGGAGAQLLQLKPLGIHQRVPAKADGRHRRCASVVQQANGGQAGHVQCLDPAGRGELCVIDLDTNLPLRGSERSRLRWQLMHDAEDLRAW